MQLTSPEQKLLHVLQTQFPLTVRPYADLGQRLGIEAAEVIQLIANLKDRGIIRLIGPVLDPHSLNYQTTLVAARIALSGLNGLEQIISTHPGVSHGYERDHYFNVWFTLAVPQTASIDIEIEKIKHASGAEAMLSLPAVKVFKIGAYFNMNGEEEQAPQLNQHEPVTKPRELSASERLVINSLQQDLPLIPAPFTELS
jgi:DNA-binding Lrp family transcriptional regulator